MALLKKSTKTLRQQLDQILQLKKGKKKNRAWNKFFGKVSWQSGPVSFQRNLRDE